MRTLCAHAHVCIAPCIFYSGKICVTENVPSESFSGGIKYICIVCPHHQPSKTVLYSQMKLCFHWVTSPPLLPLPIPGNHHSTLRLRDLTTEHTSYKWNHIILVLCAWLFSCSIVSSGPIHAVACVRMSCLFKDG